MIAQIRLPIIALIGVLVLNRRQSSLQWTLIVGVTASVMGYSSVSLTGKETYTLKGLWISLLQATCASVGSTVSEVTLKKLKFPFCVQMSQARFVSCLSSLAGLIYFLCRNEVPSVFVGWNYRICCLVVWLTFRDWVMTSVLKSLSALWKTLASGLALCFAYVFQTIIKGRSFDIVLVSFIFCLVVDILGFALSKRQVKQTKQVPASKPQLDKKDVEANAAT